MKPEPTATTNERLMVALESCANKLMDLGKTFNSTNFTDRYGDGPICVGLAKYARAVLDETRTQSETRPTTLSEFVHAPEAVREAIGAEVVDAAIQRQSLQSAAAAPCDLANAVRAAANLYCTEELRAKLLSAADALSLQSSARVTTGINGTEQTPRTDSIAERYKGDAKAWEINMLQHARQLERERDWLAASASGLIKALERVVALRDADGYTSCNRRADDMAQVAKDALK